MQALGTGYYVNNVEQNVDGKVQILNEVYLTAFTMFKLVFHLSEEVDLCKGIANEIVNCVMSKPGYESTVKVEEWKIAEEQTKEVNGSNSNAIVSEVITTDTTTEQVDLTRVKTEAKMEELQAGGISNEEGK